MKTVLSFLLFSIAFILQTTVMNSISILGITPNLILCLIVVVGFLYDNMDTFAWAVLFGLIQDAYFSQIMGVAAICYFLIAVGVYVIKDFINAENVISAIGLIIGTTIVYNFMYFGITKIFGSFINIIVLLEALPLLIFYNIIVAIILYKIFIRKVIKYRKDKKFKGKFASYE